MTMDKTCGDCGLCCKLLRIQELAKPDGQWCWNFKRGLGCSIYGTRPTECRTFHCGWLMESHLDERWKPTTARFVIWQPGGGGRLVIQVDPAYPQAWRKEPYYSTIKGWSRRDRPHAAEVTVRIGQRLIIVFPEAEIELGGWEDRPIKSGYRFEDGRHVPYAHYV